MRPNASVGTIQSLYELFKRLKFHLLRVPIKEAEMPGWCSCLVPTLALE